MILISNDNPYMVDGAKSLHIIKQAPTPPIAVAKAGEAVRRGRGEPVVIDNEQVDQVHATYAELDAWEAGQVAVAKAIRREYPGLVIAQYDLGVTTEFLHTDLHLRFGKLWKRLLQTIGWFKTSQGADGRFTSKDGLFDHYHALAPCHYMNRAWAAQGMGYLGMGRWMSKVDATAEICYSLNKPVFPFWSPWVEGRRELGALSYEQSLVMLRHLIRKYGCAVVWLGESYRVTGDEPWLRAVREIAKEYA